MTTQSIIIKKQRGKELAQDEINYLINGFISNSIPDYQMAAFLMTVYFQGMTYQETYHLTKAMLDSGEKIDTSVISGFKADKHSTGGVGDKVSLVLAPLVAAAGVIVPMISGRGLGHSGGTLDKLESIPGFKTKLSAKECIKQLENIGVAMIGQSDDIVPADKKIYALRDSTSTVRSVPLITASILSKKLAEEIDALVIDLKVGKGAFFKDQAYAYKLADSLIDISQRFGLQTSVLFTAMDQPIGNAIGNWVEVKESIDTLRGNGPEDLLEVTLALGSEMLMKAKLEKSISEAKDRLKNILASGAAYDKFTEIVKHQGGKLKYIEKPELYDESLHQHIVKSERSGFIDDINSRQIGLLAMELGAGRKTLADRIDHKAGIILKKKMGESVERNESVATVYTDLEISEAEIFDRISNAFNITPSSPPLTNPILGYATKDGISRWSD
ncbi:thymidine phosphorylase [candidate division KSB1 bacterium]|nr:thymidine phosphorylase [candidate division KSB1 bacterium]